MIQLPQRSVTRFFIPLIDVLTLLFCVFLIMPLARNPGEEGPDLRDKTPEEQVDYLRQELKRLREENLRKQQELAQLRQQKMQNLKDRLLVRVLEIDGGNGKLFERDPERVEIKDDTAAQRLIERDRRERGLGDRELYYLLLYPRDRDSPYPTRGQRRQYEHWFQGVPLGFDIPSAPGTGGQ